MAIEDIKITKEDLDRLNKEGYIYATKSDLESGKSTEINPIYFGDNGDIYVDNAGRIVEHQDDGKNVYMGWTDFEKLSKETNDAINNTNTTSQTKINSAWDYNNTFKNGETPVKNSDNIKITPVNTVLKEIILNNPSGITVIKDYTNNNKSSNEQREVDKYSRIYDTNASEKQRKLDGDKNKSFDQLSDDTDNVLISEENISEGYDNDIEIGNEDTQEEITPIENNIESGDTVVEEQIIDDIEPSIPEENNEEVEIEEIVPEVPEEIEEPPVEIPEPQTENIETEIQYPTGGTTFSGAYNALTMPIVGFSVQDKIWNSCIASGMNPAQAAGVLASVDAETGGTFNSGAFNGSGGGQGAFGLCQWRSGRQSQLKNYCAAIGVLDTDVDAQIRFMLSELTPGGNGIADYNLSGGAGKRFLGTTDPATAGNEFCNSYERPGGTVHNKRKKLAVYYYNLYTGNQ